MEDVKNKFNKKNIKRKNKSKNKNIKNTENEDIKLISREKNISMNKVPQIINNYDVKVNITKEKSNNININSMNINSLYSKTDNLIDYYNLDNNDNNNIFKSIKTIKFNSHFNKTDNIIWNKNYSFKKINLQPEKLEIKYSKSFKKKEKYEGIISKLKDEFKKIEKSYKKDSITKTRTLNNKIINKKNNKYNDMNNEGLSSLKKICYSKDKKLYPNKTKYSFDLTNCSSYRKEKNKNFKFNNFNDIYDNLINIKDVKNKIKNKNNSENANKRKKLIISTKISKNKNNKNDDLPKKERNYYKCNLFRNLNKLTFENTISYKKKMPTKKNNNKICKNIAFTYYYSKLEKYNNYFECNNDYNDNNIKSLNILNEIINIQRNIIIQQKEKEEKLKEEIYLRMNEMNKLKIIYLKFL